MEITSDTSVGTIVSNNYSTARIFEANHIDYCCGGKITLKEAAEKEGVEIRKLMDEIHAAMQHEDKDTEIIESISLSGLCTHIVNTHHSYVNEAIPFLQQKIGRAHV